MKKLGLIVILSLFITRIFAQDSENYRLILKDGWQMQSVVKDASAGSLVSQSNFIPKG